jgi:hypothetical protein
MALRYFQYIDDKGEAHGQYSGMTPKQAAGKIFSTLMRERKKEKGPEIETKINFAIKECTKDSNHITWHYVGTRVKLEEPIIYSYSNKVEIDRNVNDKPDNEVNDLTKKIEAIEIHI